MISVTLLFYSGLRLAPPETAVAVELVHGLFDFGVSFCFSK